MLHRFYFILIVCALYACGGSNQTTAPGSGARYDNEIDLENAEKLGREMYPKLIDGDSATIYKLFEPALKDEFSDFMAMLRSRVTGWGKLHKWDLLEVSSYVSANDDTIRFELAFNALYDDNASYDEITITKIGNKNFHLSDYSFDSRHMYSCGQDALEELKPLLEEYARSFVLADEDKIWQLAGNDSVFFDSLMVLSKNTFAEDSEIDSIRFEDGYMRKYCGLNGESNGIAVYKVYLDEDKFEHIIYKLKSEPGGEVEVYEVIFDGDLLVDAREDVDLAKRISKDVCKIIKESDPGKFFSTFHSELSSLYTKETQQDLKEIVADFASLGSFADYYDWHTYRTSNNGFVFFIMVVELTDAEGYSNYLEMTFKPDENDKFMLVSCYKLMRE